MGIVRQIARAYDAGIRSNGVTNGSRPWGSGLRDECVERVDAGFSARLRGAQASRTLPVILKGFSSGDSLQIADLLPEGHRFAGNVPDQDRTFSTIPADALVVINADVSADLDDVVSTLMKLRRDRPDLVIILATSTVRGDDLSLERSAICHATLKLPTRSGNVHRVLSAAMENATSIKDL